MWVSALQSPKVTRDALHQVLWSYFPDIDDGSQRPFLFRKSKDRLLMLSRIKPACESIAISDSIRAGRMYQFDVIASPRNGHNTKKPGAYKHRFIVGNAERKAWFARRITGATPGFIQVFDRPNLQLVNRRHQEIVRPACIIRGTLKVDDRAEFMHSMLSGIGGGGAWGFGLLVMPEVMQWAP